MKPLYPIEYRLPADTAEWLERESVDIQTAKVTLLLAISNQDKQPGFENDLKRKGGLRQTR